MTCENYEKEAKKIRAENSVLLDGFWEWLLVSGLKEKTIRKHAQNVDLYIND